MGNKTIGILGAGKWGKTLAKKLANSHKVKLYSKDLKTPFLKRGNLEYFQKIEKLKDSDLFIIAVPSFAIREVLNNFKPFYSGQPILGVSKGLEKETGLFCSQIVREILGKTIYGHLSGPSFAEEVAKGKPAIFSLALADFSQKKYFKEIFKLKNFQIEITTDLIGVQIAGALKNVIAIASGLADSLGYGENFRAILILKGLKEMQILGKSLGAKEKTFLGPCGLGDLILTGTSKKSRNYSFGKNFKKRKKIKETIEGIPTSFASYHLAKKFNLNLPIIEGVYKIIYKNLAPEKIFHEIFRKSL
jgi:glycerol-3-phosphate dehydrogenase (NAD(P)+)